MRKLLITLIMLLCVYTTIQAQTGVDDVVKLAIPEDTTQVLTIPGHSWFVMHRYKVDTLFNEYKRASIFREKIALAEERLEVVKLQRDTYMALDTICATSMEQVEKNFELVEKEYNKLRWKCRLVIIGAVVIDIILIAIIL